MPLKRALARSVSGRRLVAAAALALLCTTVALMALPVGDAGENPFVHHRSEGAWGATREAYVGYAPEAFHPARGHDAARVEAALEAWRDRHGDVEVVALEPVTEGGLLLGYRVTYRVAPPTPGAALEYDASRDAGGVERDLLGLAT